MKIRTKNELNAWHDEFTKTKWLDKGSKRRSGKDLVNVEKIVTHYTATSGAGSDALVGYFLRTQNEDYASAHSFVGNDCVVNCIPYDEVAHHVGAKTYMKLGHKLMKLSGKPSPNFNTIGVEMCQEGMPHESIAIPKQTLNNTVILVVYLLFKFNLTPSDVCGHCHITGKHCPAFALLGGEYGGYCTNEGQLQSSVQWISFISDIAQLYNNILQ